MVQGTWAGKPVRFTAVMAFACMVAAVGVSVQAGSVTVSAQDFESVQTTRAFMAGLALQGTIKMPLLKGRSIQVTLGAKGAGMSSFLFDKGYLKGNRVEVTNLGAGRVRFERKGSGKPLQVDVEIGNFYRPAGTRELADYLCMKPENAVSWMVAGDSFRAVMGPSGAGKSTLLFDRGYLKGDRVQVTCLNGGRMRLERMKPGAPLKIDVEVGGFYSPTDLKQFTGTMGMKVKGTVSGCMPRESFITVLFAGVPQKLREKGFRRGDVVKVTNTGGGKMRLSRMKPGDPLQLDVEFGDFYGPAGKK